MNFSNNPQAVYNGMMSGQRNMFLSSSVAVVMIGLSNKFKDKTVMWFVKLVAASIFILSIFIGLHTASDFQFYLDSIKAEAPSHIPLNSWYKWPFVSYVYSIILVIIGGFFFARKIIV